MSNRVSLSDDAMNLLKRIIKMQKGKKNELADNNEAAEFVIVRGASRLLTLKKYNDKDPSEKPAKAAKPKKSKAEKPAKKGKKKAKAEVAEKPKKKKKAAAEAPAEKPKKKKGRAKIKEAPEVEVDEDVVEDVQDDAEDESDEDNAAQ